MKRTNSVLYLTEGDKPGGPTTWVKGLSKAMRANDWDTYSISSTDPTSFIPFLKVIWNLTAIHAYHIGGFTVFYLLVAKIFRKRIVFTIHGDIKGELYTKTGLKRVLWMPFNLIAVKLSDRITFPSDFVMNKVSADIKITTPFEVIYNGIEKIDIKEATNKIAVPNRIVTITNFNYPMKARGIELLIAAINKINSHGGNLYLDILGDGKSQQNYKSRFENMNIVFRGKANVEEYLSLVDIQIHATFQDNMPYAVLEGLRHNIPVLASKVGGIPELLDPMFIFDNTQSDITQKLTACIDKYSLYIQQANELSKIEKFYWPAVVEKFARAYS